VKNIFFILFILFALCSCSEYKKFTLYKQKPFDNTSDSICINKIYTSNHNAEISKIYLQYNRIIFNSNGTSSSCFSDGSNKHIIGHYIIRHDTIYMQSFGFDVGGTYKKYLVEYFGKIINDSTIMIYKHICNFCHGQFSGYHDSPDIYFNPPIEYDVTSIADKQDIVAGWFSKKKWYKKNVWYNNQ